MKPKYRIHILTTAQTVIPKSLFRYLIPDPGQITIPALFSYIEGADRPIQFSIWRHKGKARALGRISFLSSISYFEQELAGEKIVRDRNQGIQ